jgi:hypothetical protein
MAAMETLLGLPPLQLVVEKEPKPAAHRLHCSNHFKKSYWGHSAIFKMATNEFPVLLAPSDSMEVFDRKYLVENPPMEILLPETEAWLPSDGFRFYTGGSLFEGRADSGVFSEELHLKAAFALVTFATVFQPEVYAILACSDYCLSTVSSRLVLQCLKLSTRTFYSF